MATDALSNRHVAAASRFSIGEARHIVRDLFEPRPWVYWTDFLASIFVGYFCFGAIARPRPIPFLAALLGWPTPSGQWALVGLCFVISVLALYRASLFTHELVHLREGAVRGFYPVWNFLCGVPFLMPSFMYETHVHHHVRRMYGTREDGEYLKFARGSIWGIAWYLLQSFLLPLAAVVRFGLVAPLCWVSPSVRRLAVRHMSSMVINFNYIRPEPTPREKQVWRRQEAGCVVMVWGGAILFFSGLLGGGWLLQAYATGSCVILLNAVRTLAAHRYRGDGRDMTLVEQLVDSINYPASRWIDELWAPVGLRFHALHHLFPGMPYHNLAAAHRRLMQQLPADSPYRLAESPSLFSSLRTIVRDASTHSFDTIPFGRGPDDRPADGGGSPRRDAA